MKILILPILKYFCGLKNSQFKIETSIDDCWKERRKSMLEFD